ncbi:RNA helicase, DEAD-box type, Q motif [Sesbania bispinosa]|nr:RNA helicase, DEAD-box type, Q motif [Sesbania bispinosa]
MLLWQNLKHLPPTPSTATPPPVSKSWADEAEEETNASSSSATESSSLSVEGLAIDENRKSSKLLDEPEDSNIQAVTSGDTPYTSAATFEELNLSPELVKGLYVEMKFQKPSKIQAISLPMILSPPHKDLIAQAHNGSGKTTCFVLGMLSRVDPKLQAPQALCICPTRELAIQADQMLAEDGFKDDSLRIMKDIEKFNSSCQVLLFSATFNETVKNFASRTVKKDHNKLFVKKEELSLDAVKQYKVHCPDELSKIEVIKDYILEMGENVGQSIIFVRTRNSARMLHKSLVDLGYEVSSIQGALDNEMRDKIVKEFRDGLTQVLISTDVLARGFDQQQVNLVINYDLPVKYTAGYNPDPEPDYEVYLHRVGRAGRFGRKGAVFNLICDKRDEKLLSKIVNHFGTHVSEVRENSVEDYKAALKEAGLLQ